jgi:hypothetical protein
MVNSYLATDDIAPQIIFYNGPASSGYTSARYSFYPVTVTPTFKIDGLHTVTGWNQSSCQSYINSRLSTPCYITINAIFSGNASGGTAYYAVTAEQDPGVSGQIKLWSAILEDHDIATSQYGVYNGQELMWEPRAWPLGTQGTVISFTGPYPQTINVQGTYTLNPVTMTFDNLNAVTYLQASSGSKEVLNAQFIDLPDTGTGVGGSPGLGLEDLVLTVGPNPSYGILSISSAIPTGARGTVSVFDLHGRVIEEFDAGGTSMIEPEEPGIYFVRLQTSSGDVLTERFTVIR